MDSSMPLVSYIVAVYNAERFLEKTLEALAAQTYENVEIILVDDGSTDGSAAICDEFCRRDSRFLCIHTANGGVSRARNAGLEKAAGKYVMFCDADDIPNKNIVKTLVEKSCGVDITLCGFTKVSGRKRVDETFAEEKKYTDKDEICRELIMPMCVWDYSPDGKPVRSVYGSVWRGLYAKKLFFDYSIRFDKTLKLGEDMLANAELLYRADSVRVIKDVLYDYNENPVSATHNTDGLWGRYLTLWRKTRDKLFEFVPEQDKKWYVYQLTRYAVSAIAESICRSELTYTEKNGAVKKILSEPDVKRAVLSVPDGLSAKDRMLLKMLRPALSGTVLAYYQKTVNSSKKVKRYEKMRALCTRRQR